MHNQIPYSSNNANSALPLVGSPKFNNQNYMKPFDKTLPTNSLKHYSSNPNLSLEITQPKPLIQPPSESNTYNYNPINKNLDFRNQVNHLNYGNNQQQVNNRANRGELTKSLIITDV